MSTKNIGIWVRVSTQHQVKDESPEIHEKRARMYAESRGWNVVSIYRLDALSGKSVIDYPETIRMLQDIKKGHISGLIFSKLARLARNTKELLEISEYFKEYNADLISLAESIDTSSPAGRLFFTIIAAMAQWEREEIAERIKASVSVRANMKRQIGGGGPFGYKWIDNKLQIDEKEGAIRKMMYEYYSKTKRIATTTNLLNEQGFRTRKGSLFSMTTVERLLLDPTAKGEYRSNYSVVDKNNRVALKPESEWVKYAVPALISEELWNECVSHIEKTKANKVPKGPRPVHLFAGILHCSCGKSMYVYYSSNPAYMCKPCKRKIPISDIEEIYHEQLKSFLLTDEDISTVVSRAEEEITEKALLLKNQIESQTTLSKKVAELIDMKLEGSINSSDLEKLYEPLNTQLRQIEKSIPELEAEIAFLKLEKSHSKTKHDEAKSLYENWPALPIDQKRQIIEMITEKIVLEDNSITMEMSFRPAPHNPLSKAGKSERSVFASKFYAMAFSHLP